MVYFNSHILQFIPEYSQLYIFNKINKLIDNKLNINRLHMTLMYIKMNPQFMKKLLDLDKIEIYAEKLLRNIKLKPLKSDKVIGTLNDVFAIIYEATFDFNNIIQKINKFILTMIATKLNRANITYRFRYKCERDMGVWIYIDIIKGPRIVSIGKIRSDDTLPHISFSRQAMSSQHNPVNVNDIRKIYRNHDLRYDISRTQFDMSDGYVEFTQ